MPTSSQPTVAIAGGGLAGLAAACALSDRGFKVSVYERRPFLGGRASSWEHPGTGEVVDNCQHVLFRVCTNLIEFYQRIGVVDQIRWFDQMHFIEPGGRTSILKASALPAPLHTAPAFFSFPFLNLADKLSIARALVPLMLTQPRDNGESFQQWLDRHGATENAIHRFWSPILVSALSEELDLVSVPAAAQVIRESMKSSEAREMGVPMVPLTDLYNRAGDYIRARGGELYFREPIAGFTAHASGVQIQLRNQNGSPQESSTGGDADFDFLILALPFDALDKVLPEVAESVPIRENIGHFQTAPITGVHLWFDRQISELDHAVLLDRTIQWMFHKSRLQPMRTEKQPAFAHANGAAAEQQAADLTRTGMENGEAAHSVASGCYVELVISSSKTLIDKTRSEIVDLALAEVREFFPAAREANLVKSTVIKELNATYSPRPGIDAHRPSNATQWPRIFLAGDWTATGWPATMEGAVRSGYLAAEAICRSAGISDAHFISADLPSGGLMRLFGR